MKPDPETGLHDSCSILELVTRPWHHDRDRARLQRARQGAVPGVADDCLAVRDRPRVGEPFDQPRVVRDVDLARQRLATEGAPIDLPWDGAAGRDVLARVLTEAGFTVADEVRIASTGLLVSMATAADGSRFVVEQGGPFVRDRGGLVAGDAVWRLLGGAAVLRGVGERVLALTSALPVRRSEGDLAVRAAGWGTVFDVIDVFDPEARARLASYASGAAVTPVAGFWTENELSR